MSKTLPKWVTELENHFPENTTCLVYNQTLPAPILIVSAKRKYGDPMEYGHLYIIGCSLRACEQDNGEDFIKEMIKMAEDKFTAAQVAAKMKEGG